MFKLLSNEDLHTEITKESNDPVENAMSVFSQMIAEKLEEEAFDRMD